MDQHGFALRSAILGFALATLLSQSARAEPPGLGTARALSADPNAPTFALAWRGTLRGTLSGQLPILGNVDEHGFHLSLLPLVELHNEPGNHEPLPNDDWRGRLSLEAGYSFTPRETGLGWASVTFAVQHESDHATVRPGLAPGFLELNDLALRGTLVLPLGAVSLIPTLEGVFLTGSCTVFTTPCRDLRGSSTLSSTAELLLTTRTMGAVSPFVSVIAMFLVPTGVLSRERRLVIDAGLSSRTAANGLWQGGLLVFLGNDVGITRNQTLEQVGGFLRWSR